MSIEAKIDALIAAIDRNTAAVLGTEVADAPKKGPGRPRKETAEAAATAATAAGSTQTQTSAAVSAPAQTSQSAPAHSSGTATVQSQTTANTSSGGPALTHKNCADALVKLGTELGRDAAIAALDKFGAAKLDQVKPEHYAAFIKHCEDSIVQAKNPAPSGVAGLI
jgi:hypothetical protein